MNRYQRRRRRPIDARARLLKLMIVDTAMLNNAAVPRSADELLALTRCHQHLMADKWRGCPERACKRHRLCMTPHMVCPNAPAPPALTALERARLELHFRTTFGDAAAAGGRA